MSSFGANRKPTFCFLLHLICIHKKIREVALKMNKLLAKFYESLSSFSWNRDFIPARRFFVGALTSLRQPNAPACPSTARLTVLPFEMLLLGADSLSRRNPGFFCRLVFIVFGKISCPINVRPFSWTHTVLFRIVRPRGGTGDRVAEILGLAMWQGDRGHKPNLSTMT